VRPHIRKWHTRYRIAGGSGAAVARLDHDVRARVSEAYAEALEQAFGNDPAVYVLRHVHAELTVVNPSLAGETAIARRWAGRTCAAVVRTVMRDGEDASKVMRFDDTPQFVGQFLADLIDGVAWDRWYYGAFSMYRQLALEEAIRAILLDFRDGLGAILRALAARGRLRAALARLSTSCAQELWRTALLQLPDESRREQFRIFVRTAMRIADMLELWAGDRPDEIQLVAAYDEASPQPPDWKQRRSLGETVLAVLSFAERSGLLRVTGSASHAAFRERRAEILADLDWLDHEWLGAALDAWLLESAPVPAQTQMPAPPRAAALTALQRRILERLRELLESGAVALLNDDPDSPQNALALFAALAVAEPSIALHAAVPPAITWILQTWKRIGTAEKRPADTPAQRLILVLDALLCGDNESIPSPSQPQLAPDAILATAILAPGRIVESRYAGLFLLWRAILDTRLTQLAAALGALPVSGVLLALAAEWTGETADRLDDGVVLWSGCVAETSALAQIALVDAARIEALRQEIERLMRDRSAFAPSLAPSAEDERAAPLAAIANYTVRLWAHWLPGIAQSDVAWLLQQLVLRRGTLRVDDRSIAVSLAPAPLDVVLGMAGYLKPVAEVPWLGDRRITFEIDRSLA
jgi:hypothetical protein